MCFWGFISGIGVGFACFIVLRVLLRFGICFCTFRLRWKIFIRQIKFLLILLNFWATREARALDVFLVYYRFIKLLGFGLLSLFNSLRQEYFELFLLKSNYFLKSRNFGIFLGFYLPRCKLAIEFGLIILV